MNTMDVRDMDHNQWLFWATAIPVTVVAVVVSLIGAGVLSIRDQRLALDWENVQGSKRHRHRRMHPGDRQLTPPNDRDIPSPVSE